MTSNKAILAAVITALSTLIATIQGRPDIDTMSGLDWVIVVLSAVVAGLVVYVTPNRPMP